MIKVKWGTNVTKEEKIVSSDTTIREFWEGVNVDFSRGMTTLNTAPIKPADLNKSFEELGVTDECFLYCVVKVDNA